ncbi:MAG: LysR family transcriptional regulator [Pseudomonadota bacterium]
MSRLNLEQLRTFYAVARLGGIRKAARQLHLTQPAITARIRSLETSLSTKLFERTPTGLQLTKRGEMLLKHAERFEHLAASVERDIVDPSGIDRHLRLGASETVAQSWLPNFIDQLYRRHPQLQIEIKVDISINLRAELINRELDLAILLGPLSDYSVDNVDLPDFDLAWYAAAGEPDPPAGVHALLHRPVMTYARNTRPYRELKSALLERVGPDAKLFPSSSLSACFRLIECGVGVGALPIALGQPWEDAGRIRRFDPGWIPSPLRFTAAYLGEPADPVLAAVAELARDVAESAS